MSVKAQLLKGAAYFEDLDVPELVRDDFDGVVQVRPLTDGEQAEVEALTMSGQTVRGQVGQRPTEQTVDVVESAKGQQRARRLRVAYGLSVNGDTWKPGDVAKLPPAAVTRISRKVRELTGGEGGLDDAAAAFRGDTAGSGDGDPAPDGDAAGGDPG